MFFIFTLNHLTVSLVKQLFLCLIFWINDILQYFILDTALFNIDLVQIFRFPTCNFPRYFSNEKLRRAFYDASYVRTKSHLHVHFSSEERKRGERNVVFFLRLRITTSLDDIFIYRCRSCYFHGCLLYILDLKTSVLTFSDKLQWI